MAWRDTLGRLREELAEVRAERQRLAAAEDAEIQQQREELSRQATTLGITQLLNEMNATLLNGQGEIETIVSWEAPAEGDDEDVDDLEEEEADLIATILTWEEAGERAALEQALAEAFRDELEL